MLNNISQVSTDGNQYQILARDVLISYLIIQARIPTSGQEEIWSGQSFPGMTLFPLSWHKWDLTVWLLLGSGFFHKQDDCESPTMPIIEAVWSFALCKQITILSTFDEHLVVSDSWLLQTMCLWTLLAVSFSEDVYAFPLGVYWGVLLLSHTVCELPNAVDRTSVLR